MDKALTWFIWLWMGLVIALNAFAIFGIFLSTNDAWQTWTWMQDTYSPFNFYNLIAEAIVMSPALGAVFWRDRRRKRHEGT